MAKKEKLTFVCEECSAVNDISSAPDFEVGTFTCKCGKDNTIKKADICL